MKLEFFVAYLKSIAQQGYDLKRLSLASNFVREELQYNKPIPTQEFIRGLLDLSSVQLVEYLKKEEVE